MTAMSTGNGVATIDINATIVAMGMRNASVRRAAAIAMARPMLMLLSGAK